MPTTNPFKRATNQDAAALVAKRVADMAALRNAVTAVYPHLPRLGKGEQRLISICEWSLKAEQPVSDEQSVWLQDIVNRVAGSAAVN